mmetsp:Transcript_44421/g.71149  ORF Transcript_44421/g.71149 Transcript_44421/m.71149 type:complete len:209 (-) Transcript_44421:356-982(-)
MGCGSSSQLPPDATPFSGNVALDYPKYYAVMQSLPGEWEVYHIASGQKSFAFAVIVNDAFSGYTRKDNKKQFNFVWQHIANDHQKIFFDEKGSFFEVDTDNNPNLFLLTVRHWKDGWMEWHRPDSYQSIAKFRQSRVSPAASPRSAGIAQHSFPVAEYEVTQQAQPMVVASAAPKRSNTICTDCGKDRSDGQMYANQWYCKQCYANYY